MYTLSSGSYNTSGSLRCPLYVPVVLGIYINIYTQCVCDAFKFKEGRKKSPLCV